MIGYMKPKKLREISRSYDPAGGYDYEFEYLDEQTGEYRATQYPLYVSEEDAQVQIAEDEWNEIIRQDLEELDRLRDGLIREEASKRAEFARTIKQLNAAHDPQAYLRERNMSEHDLLEMEEAVDELRSRIDELDAKEERSRRIIDERKWDSVLPAKRNRHINFYGRVLFNKKEGYYYIDLDKETDCITKRVTGKTLEELREKISIEDDRLRVKEGVIPESGSVNNSWIIRMANRSIAGLSAAETRYLLELYNFAIFGSAVDRKAAREKIFEMLGLNNSLEKINDLELRKEAHTLREIAEGHGADNWDCRAFAGYIDRYIDSTGKTRGWLCDTIGYDQANLSKCTSGKQRPSKMTAIRLALAMELPLMEIKGFMTAAGHPFPSGDLDGRIISLLIRNEIKPDRVLEMLMTDKKLSDKTIKKVLNEQRGK